MSRKDQGKKRRQTIIQNRFGGDEEAYLNWMGEIGAKGGRNGNTGGTYNNPELAKKLGSMKKRRKS